MINGKDAQEKRSPTIMEKRVGNNEVRIKYSATAPIIKGTIKKKGGAANICALSFWLCIFQLF